MKEVLFLIAGMLGLLASAELLIWALQALAEKLNISKTFLGLTVLSIGTSFPEIGTHILSSINILKGVEASGVAVGTNVGSNLVQITLILGITAFFTHIYAKKEFLKRDYAVMMGSIVLLFLMAVTGHISRIEGWTLIILYIVYLWKLGKIEHFTEKITNKNHDNRDGVAKYYLATIIGLAVLLIMAKVVVDNAVLLSELYGIEKSFIGAVIIGFGTALPEFTTAMVAMRRKAPAMSVGVLIGSNITNPLFALGIGAAISGYTVESNLIFFDIPAWFFVSLVALFFLLKKEGIRKKEALTLIFLYLLYVALRMKIAGVLF